MAVTLSNFLKNWNHVRFFHSLENFVLFKYDWKISFKSFQIESSKILLSCLWATFGGRFLIFFRIWSFKKLIVDSDWSVFFFVFCIFFYFFFVFVYFFVIENVAGAQLFLTKEQYSVKKFLNIFACFFLWNEW